MREGGVVCGLSRRPLGAETWREGLRFCSNSFFEVGGGPQGEGGRGNVRAHPRAFRGRDMEEGAQILFRFFF